MRWYRGLPFKARVFLSCLLVAMVPLLCCSVVMMRLFTTSLEHQSGEEGRRQLEEISGHFRQLLENSETACRTLTEDGYAARALISNTTVDTQRDMYLSLYQAVQKVYSHAQLSLYDAGGRLRFTTDSAPERDMLPVHWGLLRKAAAAPSGSLTYYRTDPYLSYAESGVLMQGACSIESPEGARMGYAVLNFTRSNFDNLLAGLFSSQDTLLILDSHMDPVYCSRQEYEEEETGELIASALENWENPGGRDQGFLWEQEEAYGFYFLLFRQAPISAPAVKTMGTVSLALSLFSLLLCLVISGALTKSISQPVSRLDKAMAEVKKGDLSIYVHTNRRDELGRLTESFNQMTRDLKAYLEDRVQREKDLNETTLKLYQTQLNPHFLYNTLDTIRWSAKIHQIPEIAVLAENLAVILRKSISGKPFITLREELETIDSYIRIQKIRFTGRFLYETEIPDQLEDCMIPKMLLQPLVENAIIHGLEGCENGYICIYADRKEDVLRISVTDDGKGMEQEMVRWINSPSPVRREGHLGLFNVIQILKLYYGEEYGMRAEASEEGTTITLTLPARKEGENV